MKLLMLMMRRCQRPWPICRMRGCGLVAARDRRNQNQPAPHGYCRAHARYFVGDARNHVRQEQTA